MGDIKLYGRLKKIPKRQVLFDITKIIRAIPHSSNMDMAIRRIFGDRISRDDALAKLTQVILEVIATNKAKVMAGYKQTIVELAVRHEFLNKRWSREAEQLVFQLASALGKSSDYARLVGEQFYYSRTPGRVISVEQKLFGTRLCVLYEVETGNGS